MTSVDPTRIDISTDPTCLCNVHCPLCGSWLASITGNTFGGSVEGAMFGCDCGHSVPVEEVLQWLKK